MQPSGPHSWLIVLAQGPPLYDPELLATYAMLLALLAGGGVAIGFTVRWYRSLNGQASSKEDDLDRLARALDEEDELALEERERIRAALERQKQAGDEAGTMPDQGTRLHTEGIRKKSTDS
jgi:hypothetical protein